MINWFVLKPYWLKGGIIGFIGGIFLSVLSFLCLSSLEVGGEGFTGLVCFVFILPGALFIFLFSFIDFSNEILVTWMMQIPHLIFWFLVGGIVGWVIGKIKKKSS